MEPVISTSFIPKRPVSTEPATSTHHSGSVGLLSFITFIIIAGTVVAFIGIYLYQQSLTSEQAKVQASITQAQNSIGNNFVSDMQRLSDRINSVKTLIQNHVVVSPIFAALQATTLQSVQYQTFTYQFITDPTTNAKMVEVDITGTALSYATLALQSDAYAQSSIIQNPIFSDLVVDDKTQQIGFKLVFNVDPNSLSYVTFINSLPPGTTLDTTENTAAPVPTTTAPVATVSQPAAPAGTQ